MITLYGIPNCGTCKKALLWLKERGAGHRFHDVRKDGLDAATVAAWLGEIGVDRLVNRRGTTWRKLDDATRAAIDAGDTTAIVANPTVIKRPVVDLGPVRVVGFDPAAVAAIEGALK